MEVFRLESSPDRYAGSDVLRLARRIIGVDLVDMAHRMKDVVSPTVLDMMEVGLTEPCPRIVAAAERALIAELGPLEVFLASQRRRQDDERWGMVRRGPDGECIHSRLA